MTSLFTYCGKLLLGMYNQPPPPAGEPGGGGDSLAISDCCCCPEHAQCCGCDCHFPVAPPFAAAQKDALDALNGLYPGGDTQVVGLLSKHYIWPTPGLSSSWTTPKGDIRDWHLSAVLFQTGESSHAFGYTYDWCSDSYKLWSGCTWYVPVCIEYYDTDPYCEGDCDPCDPIPWADAEAPCCVSGPLVQRAAHTLKMTWAEGCYDGSCDEFSPNYTSAPECIDEYLVCENEFCSWKWDNTAKAWVIDQQCANGPCSEQCIWTWSAAGSSWSITTDCTETDCDCPGPPTSPGTTDGETISYDCVQALGSVKCRCSDEVVPAGRGRCGETVDSHCEINAPKGCQLQSGDSGGRWICKLSLTAGGSGQTCNYDSIPGECNPAGGCYGCNEACYKSSFSGNPITYNAYRFRGCLTGGENGCRSLFLTGTSGGGGTGLPTQGTVDCDECTGDCQGGSQAPSV